MYQKQSGLILAFHGCDITVQQQAICSSSNILLSSNNDYDWLGHGIYFWENSPQRAIEFARESAKRNKSDIKKPAVLGAAIELGRCLDLLDSANLQLVKAAYEDLKQIMEMAGEPMPKNKVLKNGNKHDLLLRQLDCFVLEHLLRNSNFDSVRGLFPEGEELYTGAGFRIKDHIQICIRNPNCIKGFFIPRTYDKKFPVV